MSFGHDLHDLGTHSLAQKAAEATAVSVVGRLSRAMFNAPYQDASRFANEIMREAKPAADADRLAALSGLARRDAMLDRVYEVESCEQNARPTRNNSQDAQLSL